MKARDFFDQKFAEKIAKDPTCLSKSGVRSQSVAVDISGEFGGQWNFEFDSAGQVQMHKGLGSASCVISMKDEIFEDMARGKLNVPFAFLMRKIKVKGDAGLAGRLGLALQDLFR